jgi:preprotein translocase subunit SecG
MYIFLSILVLLASIILIFIVLIQNSKGGGLASGFTASNQIMGVRKTTDFLEKATWGLASVVLVGCVLVSLLIPRTDQNAAAQSEISKQVNEATAVDPAVLGPDFGTAQPVQEPAAPIE